MTLVGPHDRRQILRRLDIDELTCLGKSMMPEGFELLMPDNQDLADLLAFIREAIGGQIRNPKHEILNKLEIRNQNVPNRR